MNRIRRCATLSSLLLGVALFGCNVGHKDVPAPETAEPAKIQSMEPPPAAGLLPIVTDDAQK